MVRITASLLVVAFAYASNVSTSPVNGDGATELVNRQTRGGKLPFVPEPEIQCRMISERCLGTVGFCQSSRNHGGFKNAEECIGARESAPASTTDKKQPFVPEPEFQCRMVSEQCLGTMGFCQSERHGGFKSVEECLASRQPAPAPAPAPASAPAPPAGGDGGPAGGKLPFVADPGPVTCRALNEVCLGTVKFCDRQAHGGFGSAKECVDARQPAPKQPSNGRIVFPEN